MNRVYMTCQRPGCQRQVSGGKPRCHVHVLDLPYALEVNRAVERRETEERLVREGGWAAVDLQGLWVKEILIYLEAGLLEEVGGMWRCINMQDYTTFNAFIDALENAGKVERFGRTPNLGGFVRLTQKNRRPNLPPVMKLEPVEPKASEPRMPKRPKRPKRARRVEVTEGVLY